MQTATKKKEYSKIGFRLFVAVTLWLACAPCPAMAAFATASTECSNQHYPAQQSRGIGVEGQEVKEVMKIKDDEGEETSQSLIGLTRLLMSTNLGPICLRAFFSHPTTLKSLLERPLLTPAPLAAAGDSGGVCGVC